MLIYRIARQQHIKDLSGIGAKLYGGRWNKPGVAVVYAAESRALAALEVLVHMSKNTLLPDYVLGALLVPPNLKITTLSKRKLPTDWQSFPAPEKLAEIGTEWIQKNNSPLLKVPSAIIQEEFNYLINPGHPDFRRIKIKQTRAFKFDYRLS